MAARFSSSRALREVAILLLAASLIVAAGPPRVRAGRDGNGSRSSSSSTGTDARR